ncbi:F-box/LRR-repeat protein 3-like isoform X1 [Benincasa hispida]|uniref:F-box/LRR-repeat protein 3-like isoform X1 n=2 Tax=Benincasa hispida TaxID=102211 RepID=UPI0019011C8D|nr:F-box/LRR-repeat protein 3-like isoform X1 [Benincasa hispida]
MFSNFESTPSLKKKLKTTEMNNPFSGPFDHLTEEIIFAILDHLHDDPFSRKSFSLVCKSFYAAESLHRKSLRPLRSDLIRTISPRYPSISKLDLSLCSHVEDSFLISVSSAWKTTLRSIDLSRSRSFSNVGLSNLVTNCTGLVEINLSNGVALTDSALKVLAEAKNLEKLWLSRCKSITDMGIGCVAVGCRKLKLLCLNWCLHITDLGVGLIATKCKELRSLDLSFLPITEKCLPSILQLQHLEELVLEECHGIDDEGLEALKRNCKRNSLKILNLSRCQSISHSGLSSLINGSEDLQKLNLSYGSSITTDMAKCLHNISGLQSIKLDCCSLTTSGVKAIANWRASLQELSLSKCTGVTDECLSIIVQKHKQLRKLDITCCRKITYASINWITSSCSSLVSLKMESCSLVPSEAYVLIGERCPYLEELDVTDNEIDNEGLKSISKCSRLSVLKLGICVNINDDGLLHIASGCPKIKELDLYRLTGITDRGIAATAGGCPALEMINIAYNDKITDSSLISLSKCSRLKALEIRGCCCISSVGLSAIAMGCKQLTVLDIKKCVNVNDDGMLPLAQFSHNLKQINLSYCSVTDVGLLSLASINCLRNVTILHLAGLTPDGLTAALLVCGGLRKVKLHLSFKSLLPPSFRKYMETRGCVLYWRDKAFQVDRADKDWNLHSGKSFGGST